MYVYIRMMCNCVTQMSLRFMETPFTAKGLENRTFRYDKTAAREKHRRMIFQMAGALALRVPAGLGSPLMAVQALCHQREQFRWHGEFVED
jgi:hypothetical protein